MLTLPDTNLLSSVPLFQKLTPPELNKLRELLHFKVFPAGTIVINMDQPGEAIYFILRGTAKIQLEQSDGSEVILAILGPGQVIGELSLIDKSNHSANVITLEESVLGWIDKITFSHLLETMPALGVNLMMLLSQRLRLANEQIQALASLDVYGRVAHQLVSFALEYGNTLPGGDITIPIRLTQSDLSGLIGATRVRVNQVLAVYKQLGFISINPNYHITIHNMPALTRYFDNFT